MVNVKKKKEKKRLKNQNFSHFSILISVTRLLSEAFKSIVKSVKYVLILIKLI